VAPLPGPGDVIAGKYRITGSLGRGGMGAVFEAEHLLLGRPVAIKLLVADLGDSGQAGQRFVREARAAMSLQSEHVVRVFDLGLLDSGVPFMVMELLEGSDLAVLVRERGPLPVGDAVDYVLQACEGLAEAHARGIVHRDLKPSNLFLTRRANGAPLVKVLDFGISKVPVVENVNAETMTSTHAFLGSPTFMAPEQVRSAKTVDARADVWSLGVVLHVLLAGRPPFRGETLSALVAAIAADVPDTLDGVRGDVPPPFAAVIRRCLSKPAEQRFADAAAVATALAPFASALGTVSADRIAALYGARQTAPAVSDGARPAGETSPFASTLGVVAAPATGKPGPSAPARSAPIEAALDGTGTPASRTLDAIMETRTADAPSTRRGVGPTVVAALTAVAIAIAGWSALRRTPASHDVAAVAGDAATQVAPAATPPVATAAATPIAEPAAPPAAEASTAPTARPVRPLPKVRSGSRPAPATTRQPVREVDENGIPILQ